MDVAAPPHLPSLTSPASVFLVILFTGIPTMAVLGGLLDRLRCPRGAFAITWLTAAAIILALALGSFPSYERAMAKNGSLQAYVLFAANLGLSLASLLLLLITTGRAAGRRIARRRLCNG